jgi:probable HAF family extracellular repeat protein
LGGNWSYATGINDSGQVVGGSYTAESDYHAFITGPDGTGMRDLGTLGGVYSEGRDINNAGQVAGGSWTAENLLHAFITGPDGAGMRDLGTLGGNDSEAYGINDAGQVVGYSRTAEGSFRAFITGPDGEGMTDLNSLLDLPDGIILTRAIDINDQGQVLAYAVAPIPEPETYTLMLAGVALVGLMCGARRQKTL